MKKLLPAVLTLTLISNLALAQDELDKELGSSDILASPGVELIGSGALLIGAGRGLENESKNPVKPRAQLNAEFEKQSKIADKMGKELELLTQEKKNFLENHPLLKNLHGETYQKYNQATHFQSNRNYTYKYVNPKAINAVEIERANLRAEYIKQKNLESAAYVALNKQWNEAHPKYEALVKELGREYSDAHNKAVAIGHKLEDNLLTRIKKGFYYGAAGLGAYGIYDGVSGIINESRVIDSSNFTKKSETPSAPLSISPELVDSLSDTAK